MSERAHQVPQEAKIIPFPQEKLSRASSEAEYQKAVEAVFSVDKKIRALEEEYQIVNEAKAFGLDEGSELQKKLEAVSNKKSRAQLEAEIEKNTDSYNTYLSTTETINTELTKLERERDQILARFSSDNRAEVLDQLKRLRSIRDEYFIS